MEYEVSFNIYVHEVKLLCFVISLIYNLYIYGCLANSIFIVPDILDYILKTIWWIYLIFSMGSKNGQNSIVLDFQMCTGKIPTLSIDAYP